MPGFDGTGPLGQGPMTGRGQGFCVLKSSKENPNQLEGLAGLQGRPISKKVNSFENAGKESINVPAGNGIGPAVRSYGTGYSMSFGGRVNSWFRKVFGFSRSLNKGRGYGYGRGRGYGHGRGRFGYRS